MRKSALALSVFCVVLPFVCNVPAFAGDLLEGGAILSPSRNQSASRYPDNRNTAPPNVRTAGLFSNMLGLPVPQQWQGQMPTGRNYAARYGNNQYRGAANGGMANANCPGGVCPQNANFNPNCPNGNCPQGVLWPNTTPRSAQSQWQNSPYRPARLENDVYSSQYNPQDFNLRQQYSGTSSANYGANVPCRECANGQCRECANGNCRACANGQPCDCPVCSGSGGNCVNGNGANRNAGNGQRRPVVNAPYDARFESQYGPRTNSGFDNRPMDPYRPRTNDSNFNNAGYGYPNRSGENLPMNYAPTPIAGGVARI